MVLASHRPYGERERDNVHVMTSYSVIEIDHAYRWTGRAKNDD